MPVPAVVSHRCGTVGQSGENDQIDAGAADVDIPSEKAAAGLPYATTNEDGTVVIVQPDGTRTRHGEGGGDR